MNTDVDAAIGSGSMSVTDKTLKKEDCDPLCKLMTLLIVKATTASLDCNCIAIAFQESFVSEVE
jgi:hypothetical protein